jgi:predicted nucleic acid-binding protein
MAILLDTNILLRIAQPHSAHAPIAERALAALRFRGETLHITSQYLVEFWAVATRPAMENGLGLTVEEAISQMLDLKRLFALLPEIPLQTEWERLVTTYRVSGRNSHDARLVAAMMVHGIRSILTFNVQDFSRCTGITVLDPRLVVSG